MNISILPYSAEYEQKWDDFVLKESINGTFLQTRKFLNYHKEGKFTDCSFMFFNGNALVAVIPANLRDDLSFVSHGGSTFGGIIVSPNVYNVDGISLIMDLFEEELLKLKVKHVFIKQTPEIFCKDSALLIDYFLYQKGYKSVSELNFYMPMDRFEEDVTSGFTSGKRRDFRYASKNDLTFKLLTTKEEIAQYYEVLLMNLKKLNLTPVHSLEDLYDLKFNRFDERIRFYGVFYEGKIIAGSMIFLFQDDIFHTQYLSSDKEYLKLYSMDFLVGNLIAEAKKEGKRLFTFGICTEDKGRYLNMNLSHFKEGFKADYCINYSYEKDM